jgi:hypothetical protein
MRFLCKKLSLQMPSSWIIAPRLGTHSHQSQNSSQGETQLAKVDEQFHRFRLTKTVTCLQHLSSCLQVVGVSNT